MIDDDGRLTLAASYNNAKYMMSGVTTLLESIHRVAMGATRSVEQHVSQLADLCG
jgi:hypothetical protein